MQVIPHTSQSNRRISGRPALRLGLGLTFRLGLGFTPLFGKFLSLSVISILIISLLRSFLSLPLRLFRFVLVVGLELPQLFLELPRSDVCSQKKII